MLCVVVWLSEKNVENITNSRETYNIRGCVVENKVIPSEMLGIKQEVKDSSFWNELEIEQKNRVHSKIVTWQQLSKVLKRLENKGNMEILGIEKKEKLM